MGTNSFLIKVQNSDLKVYQFAKVSNFEKKDQVCVFQRNESILVNLKIFRQVCFNGQSSLFEKAQFSIVSCEELVR